MSNLSKEMIVCLITSWLILMPLWILMSLIEGSPWLTAWHHDAQLVFAVLGFWTYVRMLESTRVRS